MINIIYTINHHVQITVDGNHHWLDAEDIDSFGHWGDRRQTSGNTGISPANDAAYQAPWFLK